MADVFWLSCSATLDDAPPPPSASAEHGTWRDCLMWRITIHQLRALPGSSVALDIWQAGTLHILVRAPRTRSGSGRMTFAPAAEDFGETLVLVLDYAGPAITAFMTLKGSDAKLRGPVLAALDIESDPSAPPDDALMTNSLREHPGVGDAPPLHHGVASCSGRVALAVDAGPCLLGAGAAQRSVGRVANGRGPEVRCS